MNQFYILGIHATDRAKHVDKIQKILSKYGCYIKTRLGLHEANDKICSPNGVILLNLVPDKKIVKELYDNLSEIDGVQVKKMFF
jgi:hypothetical protein